MDHDHCLKDDCIGVATLPLDEVDLSDTAVVIWKAITHFQQEQEEVRTKPSGKITDSYPLQDSNPTPLSKLTTTPTRLACNKTLFPK